MFFQMLFWFFRCFFFSHARKVFFFLLTVFVVLEDSFSSQCVKMRIEVTKQDDYFLRRCGVRDVRRRSCHTEEDTTHH